METRTRHEDVHTSNTQELVTLLTNNTTSWHSNDHSNSDYYGWPSNATCWHSNRLPHNCTAWRGDNGTSLPVMPSDTYREWEAILYSRVIVAISVFGVIGNILNLIVLSMKRFSGYGEVHQLGKSANIGLLALSFSDLVACLSLIPQARIDTTEQFFASWFDAQYTAHTLAFTNIFVLSSTWLIVSMATSRYIVICQPLKAKTFISTKSTKAITGLVVVVCFLLTLPQFWENEVTRTIVNTSDGSSVLIFYIKHDGYLKLHRTQNLVYWCVHFTLGILIPFLVLIFCNVSLLRSLHRTGLRDPSMPHPWLTRHSYSLRSSETRLLTLTLVIIVVMYIVFDIPAEMVRFLQQVAGSEHSGVYNLGVAILNTLQIVNFAFNFILYCAISSLFRKCMRDLIMCHRFVFSKERRRQDAARKQLPYQASYQDSPSQSGVTRFSFKNTRRYPQLLQERTGSNPEIKGAGESTRNSSKHQYKSKHCLGEEETIPLQTCNGNTMGPFKPNAKRM